MAIAGILFFEEPAISLRLLGIVVSLMGLFLLKKRVHLPDMAKVNSGAKNWLQR